MTDSGWEKGQVEKNVQDARRRLWQPMPNFPDLEALNAWLEVQCIMQWSHIQHGSLFGTVADAHAEEVASLMPLGHRPLTSSRARSASRSTAAPWMAGAVTSTPKSRGLRLL